jgi:hypothetical protein
VEFFGGGDLDNSDITYIYLSGGEIFFDFEGGAARIDIFIICFVQQIYEVFHIEFDHIATYINDVGLAHRLGYLKKFGHDSRGDPRVRLVPLHRVGLPRTCLPIGEDCDVIPVHSRLYEVLSVFIHLFLC